MPNLIRVQIYYIGWQINIEGIYDATKKISNLLKGTVLEIT